MMMSRCCIEEGSLVPYILSTVLWAGPAFHSNEAFFSISTIASEPQPRIAHVKHQSNVLVVQHVSDGWRSTSSHDVFGLKKDFGGNRAMRDHGFGLIVWSKTPRQYPSAFRSWYGTSIVFIILHIGSSNWFYAHHTAYLTRFR